MTLSVAIATYNEGPDLRATVALLYASDPRPDQIVVVNDCSSTDVKAELASWPDVEYHRTPGRLGSGAAKQYAVERCNGDIVIIMDAHMRMGSDWLQVVHNSVNRYPDAIFCCQCTGVVDKPNFHGGGVRFVRKRLWPEIGCLAATNKDTTVPCLYGGCYIWPRHVLEEVPPNPHFVGWGFEEQDLSLRAWMAGYSVRCIPATVAHNFKKDKYIPGRRLNELWYLQYNAALVCSTVFENGVFNRVYRPFIMKDERAKRKMTKKAAELLHWRNFVQSKRLYSDAELQSLCGFRLPNVDDQHRIINRAEPA